MGEFECYLQEGAFMNHRELKELRRELVEKMNAQRVRAKKADLSDVEAPAVQASTQTSTGLNVLLRNKIQVDGFAEAVKSGFFQNLEHQIHNVILDFEFGKDYATSVELMKSLGFTTAIATTRILKPKEYHNLKMISRCNPDKILVRNLGAIEFLNRETRIPLLGDFSLNVTNSLTAQYLIGKGLETVNASYDLNQEQLLDLIEHMDASTLEVTLHQYMPEFHMEHCVFAAFLSKGHSFKDCGKPCEKHEVKLKDPYGNWHHLKADQECRNTFFKATPQSASFLVKELKAKNVRSLRLEALNELPQELNEKILAYLKLLHGDLSSQEVVAELKLMESYGLGMGQLHKSDTYKDRKKELR
jgi:putative protease